MKKITLLDTPFAEARSVVPMLRPTIEFLIKNPEVILSEKDYETLTSLKFYSSSPVSTLYQTLVAAKKLTNFLLLDLSSVKNDLPELLTIDKLIVDGKYIPNLSVPTPIQKCWVNLTPVLGKRATYNGALTINDTTQLSAIVIKAFLCGTYHDTDMWLNPKLATFVIESYSMTIAGVIANAYNLDLYEKRFVQTLFAIYYAQSLGGSNSDFDTPPLLMRCPFLGSVADITRCLEVIEPHREAGTLLTPSLICTLLQKVGPPRLANFSNVQLYRYLSSSALDSAEMMIAIDYPPYWVYQLIRVASGYKNPVMSNIIKLTNTKLKLMQFAKELESSSLISNFNR